MLTKINFTVIQATRTCDRLVCTPVADAMCSKSVQEFSTELSEEGSPEERSAERSAGGLAAA
jgi:hypothetical protein